MLYSSYRYCEFISILEGVNDMKRLRTYFIAFVVFLYVCGGCSNARSSYMSGIEIMSNETNTDTSFGFTYQKFDGYRKVTIAFQHATYVQLSATAESGTLQFMVKNSDDVLVFEGDLSSTGFEILEKGDYTFEIKSSSEHGSYLFSWD